MKRCKYKHLLWLVAALVFSCEVAFGASSITGIDFQGTSDPSIIKISFDGPVTYQKIESPENKQVILELSGVRLPSSQSRKMDTSSFDSTKVLLINPYQVQGQADTVRIVVQLKDTAATQVDQDANHITLRVSASSSSQAGGSASAANNPVPALGSSQASQDASRLPASQVMPVDEFMADRETKLFSGKKITLQTRDADVADILGLISDASGFNIVIADDVKGKLTLSLVDVPWDQALDLVLHSLRLGAERNNNVLRVMTLASLTEEKRQELSAKNAAAAVAPRVTKVFQINYATLTDLQMTLARFLGGAVGSSGGSGLAGSIGSGGPVSVSGVNIQADHRTNRLVIQDTEENLNKVQKLIELLDTQTPQVMIEAKIIEATEDFGNSLQGSLGVGSGDQTAFASFIGGNPIDPLVGSPGTFANGAAIMSQSAPTTGSPLGVFGFSPNLSFIPGGGRLTAVLNLGESESKVKVISSPKTVVLNKETATITEGTPVSIPGTTTVAGVGTVQTATVQQANVSLNVTPTVANDGSVLMKLNVSKDIPETLAGGTQTAIGTRNLQTSVLVESGTTLVIGGIYTTTTNHSAAGFPILRDIPIIGALFGSKTDSTDRSELFIFITPRIVTGAKDPEVTS